MDEQRLTEIRARLAARYAWAPGARTTFRAHAPADIAALLDALATATAERDTLRDLINAYRDAPLDSAIESDALEVLVSAEIPESPAAAERDSLREAVAVLSADLDAAEDEHLAVLMDCNQFKAERDHHHRAMQYVRRADPDLYQRALNDAAQQAERDAAQEVR